jgi:Zn finger protein HypA/HybF involved in hydrogenase expression
MKTKLKKLECKRCGKIWIPRIENIVVCPKCKSPRWDTRKIDKNHNNLQEGKENG